MDKLNGTEYRDVPINLEVPPEPNIELKMNDELSYRYHGTMPNWFHRKMQHLIFGFEYEELN